MSLALNGGDVLKAVCTELGTDLTSDNRVEPLLDSLRGRRVLIVLDNCEHVIATCADLSRSLLQACSDVRVLATSRQVLAVDGEVVCATPPLSLPAENETSAERLRQSEAACLFLERVAASVPAFALTAAAVPSVAEICRHLDGVPLALELAAARVRSVGLNEVASIARDHLRLLNLRANRLSLPARQRSLRASLDWSFDLLVDTERVLLQQMALLSGQSTLHDVQRLCTLREVSSDAASVRDILDNLVAQSLLLVEHDERSTRYWLPGTVRHYALEQVAAPRQDRAWPSSQIQPRRFRGRLTPREQQVLSLLARGCSNKEIGAELAISGATARVHVEHILAKLDLRSRTQAAVWALRCGLRHGDMDGQVGGVHRQGGATNQWSQSDDEPSCLPWWGF
jgi:predicted ATPase/DNA-binding CsgD family transcriptional regulator